MAKVFSVAVDIGGKINPSLGRAIKGTESAITAMGRRVSQANVAARDVVNSAGRGVAAAGRRLQDTGRHVTASVSAPLGLLGIGAGKMAFEFEKAGNMLEALGDASSEQRTEFEALANTLNKKYPQSLSGIINTGNEMLKGGFNFDQMKGAIDQTLATAVLGDMSPAEVGNMMARTINSFQMPMKTYQDSLRSSQRVSDQMTFAAVKTTASLKDMGEMYRYVGGASSAAGISLEQASAFAMAFAKNGSVGSDAGVAMRSAIVRLVKMPPGALAAMERVGMSYEVLRRDLQAAVDNLGVKAILLNIDSPGGEMAGINELALAVKAVRGVKPIVAYVGDLGASAAYWLATSADSIVIGVSAALGSIGVRASYSDTSARDAARGVASVDLVSSQSPYKKTDLVSDEGRARVQARVDTLAQVFVEAVAANRGVSVDRVLDAFGKGDVLIGKAAVAAGMADEIGTFEGTLAALAAGKAITHSPALARPIMSESTPRPAPLKSAPTVLPEVAADRARAQRIIAMAPAGAEQDVAEALRSGMSVSDFEGVLAARAILAASRVARGR